MVRRGSGGDADGPLGLWPRVCFSPQQGRCFSVLKPRTQKGRRGRFKEVFWRKFSHTHGCAGVGAHPLPGQGLPIQPHRPVHSPEKGRSCPGGLAQCAVEA